MGHVAGIATALALMLAAGGCVGGRSGSLTTGSLRPAGLQAAPRPADAKPEEDRPASPTLPASAASAPTDLGDGEIVTRYVAGTGMVRATRQVFAGLGRPLQGQPGPNRTVAACREAALTEAQKLGARDLEAVSAGAERTDRQGRVTAPVMMRITYPVTFGVEIREAVMTCTVDRAGRIVDARI